MLLISSAPYRNSTQRTASLKKAILTFKSATLAEITELK
jgi:hypothetical protein